jgi:hypothetical protein
MYDLATTTMVTTGTVAAAALMRRQHLAGQVRRPAFLSILATLAFSFAAHAQKPRPPVLVTAGAPLPASALVFRETFESMPLGLYQPIAGAWTRGDNPMGCCTIASTNPVSTGFGKYFHPYNIKTGTTNFRSEYWYVGTPYASPRVNLTSLGDHEYVGNVYWYGYHVCVDKSEITTGYGIYVNQWHTDNPPEDGGGYNPMFALIAGINGQLQAYIEHSDESPPANPGDFPGDSVLVNVPTPGGGSYVGKCFDVIWQLKMDTRVSTNGSTGTLRLWLGESSTPVFEWVNKQVGHETDHYGNSYMPYFNIGGYQSRWRDGLGTEGEEWEARYDNVTVMNSAGSWAAMKAALQTPN